MNETSPYRGVCVLMTTKHAKSLAVGPPFAEILGAGVMEYVRNTDQLGTFSGEVERQGDALECARRKCEWSMELAGVEYGVASEGSFGAHPFVLFIPCGREILYFIDRKRGFQLHLSRLCEKTNYRMQATDTTESLQRFAEQALFPSHALIVRPNRWHPGQPIFKGIDTTSALQSAFRQSRDLSPDGLAWIETDMRAHMNPTRMNEIGELARELARRLATACPCCHTPGWGVIRRDKGLRCEYCDQHTSMTLNEVFGCTLCNHTEHQGRHDGLTVASQMHCAWCNP